MVGRQLLSFSIIGTIGFLVDTATLYLAIGVLGALGPGTNYYSSWSM